MESQKKHTTTTDFLFALIRNALFGTEIKPNDIPENIDWQKLLTLAKMHTVVSLISESIAKLPEDKRPPQNIVNNLMVNNVRVIMSHQLLEKKLSEVASHLHSKGIRPVLLKGQGIALLYPNPQTRQCGDIDIYVGERQYAAAHAAMLEKWTTDDDDDIDDEKHQHFYADNILIELHQYSAKMDTPWRNKKFQKWSDQELLDPEKLHKGTFNGVEVAIPSPAFNSIYIFYHLWRHFLSSGVGLRHLSDWALVLHKHAKDMDKVKIMELVNDFGLLKPWQIMGCILVEKIGLPADEMPGYNPALSLRSEEALRDVMAGGNFGHFSNERNKAKAGQSAMLQKYHRARHWVLSFLKQFHYDPLEVTFHSFYIMRHIIKKGFDK